MILRELKNYNMEMIKNKAAYFDYEIMDTLEAGLILSGQEVKAVKNGQVNLKGAYLDWHKDEPGIINMTISKYKAAGPLADYDPKHWRKILLHKRQISYLKRKSSQKGLTIIPLKVYIKGRLIKVEIGVAKGKKKYNKKEILKKKDLDKEVKRTLKNYRP